MGKQDGAARRTVRMRRTMGHQDLPSHSILAVNAESQTEHGSQGCRSIPRLLADAHEEHTMHDCATPPYHEFLFQLKLRPDDHEHTSTSTAQGTYGPQEEITPDTALLIGRLHNTLCDLVQASILHSAIQRLLGLLVLP